MTELQMLTIGVCGGVSLITGVNAIVEGHIFWVLGFIMGCALAINVGLWLGNRGDEK